MIKRSWYRGIVQGLFLILCGLVVACNTQTKKVGKSDDTKNMLPSDRSLQIAFYNVENLFDTLPQQGKKDDDFTPNGRLKWNTERYKKKLEDLAAVFDSMGWPQIIGLAEVEFSF